MKNEVITKREKKLRYAGPWEAILYFCGPMVLIMIIQGIYNIIDKSMAQSFVNGDKNTTNLVTAYSMTPYYILFSVSGIFGFGNSITFSIEYGKRNLDKMKKIVGNMIGLQITMSILTSFVLFFLMNPEFGSPLVRLQINGQLENAEKYYQLTWEYSRVFIFASPLLFLSYALPTFLRTEGKVFLVLLMQIISIPVNVLFSWIFAEKAHLQMTGVMMGSMFAWAFNIIFSLCIMFGSKNSYSSFTLKDMKWELWIIKQSLPSGLGSFFMYFANALQILVATILTAHLPNNESINGAPLCQLVYTSMAPFFLMFTSVGIGLSQGTSTICAFAFGAKKYLRIKRVMSRVAILQFIWFSIVTIVILAFSKEMMLLYYFPAKYVDSYRWRGTLLFSTYFFVSFTYLSTSLYSSIRKSFQTIISSMLRSLLVFIPLAFIGYGVSLATNDNIYYFVFSGLTDFVCACILIPLLYSTWNKSKNKIIDHNDYYIS